MKEQMETKETYNKIAKEYAALNNDNQEVIHFQHKFKDLLGKGKVYDLGCGTGRDTNALRKLGLDVTGFDYSEGMLEVARQSFPKCSFKRLDMLNELHKLEQTDGVWACASLLHFNEVNFKKVLNSIIDLIRQEGLLYISLKLSESLDEEVINGRYFKYYTDSELRRIFESLNLDCFYHKINGNEERKVFGNYILKKNVA